MSAEVLLTEANSVLGSSIMQELASGQIRIRAALGEGEELHSSIARAAGVACLDYDSLGSVRRALTGVHSVILLSPLHYQAAEFARRIIYESVRMQVRSIIHVSMMESDTPDSISFLKWHREIENDIEECGIPNIFIRANIYMQEFFGLFAPVNGMIRVPLADCRISYIDARDVAFAVAFLLRQGERPLGTRVTITGSRSLSLADITGTLSRILGTTIDYENISESAFRTAMRVEGKPGWYTDGVLQLCAAHELGYGSAVLSTYANLTGKEPHTFEQFARDYEERFQALIEQEYHLRV